MQPPQLPGKRELQSLKIQTQVLQVRNDRHVQQNCILTDQAIVHDQGKRIMAWLLDIHKPM